VARRHRPRSVEAVALWPGAGSSSTHPSLIAIEEALAPLPVARFDFPYRREGRRAPDRAPKLIASIVEEVTALCDRLGTTPAHVVLGGRSMGGRMCSMAVAEGLPAAGLVLMCYPLHPPGRPENLRTAHLPDLSVPCLFLCGDRDPFGTPDELSDAIDLIPGPVTSVTIEGARHELKGAEGRLVSEIRDWLGPAGRRS
jgi:uncharacterized protein